MIYMETEKKEVLAAGWAQVLTCEIPIPVLTRMIIQKGRNKL